MQYDRCFNGRLGPDGSRRPPRLEHRTVSSRQSSRLQPWRQPAASDASDAPISPQQPPNVAWAPKKRQVISGQSKLVSSASPIDPYRYDPSPALLLGGSVWATRSPRERRVIVRSASEPLNPKPQGATPPSFSLTELVPSGRPLILPRSYATSTGPPSTLSPEGPVTGPVRTLIPCDQKSNDWHDLRKSRATASVFSQMVGVSPFQDGRGIARHQFFMEKLGIVKVVMNAAMRHGNRMEPIALEEYERRSGLKVASAGFISYRASKEEDDFIGGSPDGVILTSDDAVAAMKRALANPSESVDETLLRQVLSGGGILEIKCPYASTPKHRKSPSEQIDKNARYMFQIQGMIEIMDLDYGELFVYSAATGHAPMIHRVRVQRDRAFWAKVYSHVKDYWLGHFLPAGAFLAERSLDGSLDQMLPIESPMQYRLRIERLLMDQGLMPSATLKENGTGEMAQWAKDILTKGEVIR